MRCLIAAEQEVVDAIACNLSKIPKFEKWTFETCTNTRQLEERANGDDVDVLVLSRFLPGADPVKLLDRLKVLYPTTHIVLLVGQKTESCKAYIRAANRAGLHNIVTGKLPGDRPYTLVTALTRPRDPDLDGYEELEETAEIEELAERKKETGNAPVSEEIPVKPVVQGDFDMDTQANEFKHNHFKIPDRTRMPARQSGPSRYQEHNLYSRTNGIVVLSAANKGGVGKTTVSAAVAMALSRAGVPTALVDLDLGGPNVASLFKIAGVPGIERLANIEKISPLQVRKLLVEVSDNLNVLPGPMDKTFPFFEGRQLAEIVDAVRGEFPVVVCDTPQQPWTKPWIYDVFEHSNLVLAVVDQSTFSEEETKRYAPTLLAMGVPPENIRIVVNRFSPRLHNVRAIESAFCSGFKADVDKALLPKVAAVIPEDWEGFVQKMYKGEIAKLDDAGSQWHKLAGEIAALAGYRYNPNGKGGGGTKRSGLKAIFNLLKR